MSSAFTATLPVLSLILGFWLTQVSYRSSRRDRSHDALLEQRSAAYRAFIRDVHTTAHLIGRAAPNCPQPIDDRIEAFAGVDRDVARGLYELEVFAGQQALHAARELRRAVANLRQAVIDGAEYMDPTYSSVLDAYWQARTAFLTAARTELLTTQGYS